MSLFIQKCVRRAACWYSHCSMLVMVRPQSTSFIFGKIFELTLRCYDDDDDEYINDEREHWCGFYVNGDDHVRSQFMHTFMNKHNYIPIMEATVFCYIWFGEGKNLLPIAEMMSSTMSIHAFYGIHWSGSRYTVNTTPTGYMQINWILVLAKHNIEQRNIMRNPAQQRLAIMLTFHFGHRNQYALMQEKKKYLPAIAGTMSSTGPKATAMMVLLCQRTMVLLCQMFGLDRRMHAGFHWPRSRYISNRQRVLLKSIGYSF